jgi:hypothetical protein
VSGVSGYGAGSPDIMFAILTLLGYMVPLLFISYLIGMLVIGLLAYLQLRRIADALEAQNLSAPVTEASARRPDDGEETASSEDQQS